VAKAGFYYVILSQESLYGFGFCRRLNDNKIFSHFRRLVNILKTGTKVKQIPIEEELDKIFERG
jgi:hypothetical protein